MQAAGRSSWLLLLASLALITLAGCGSSDASISGKVTLDGVPLERGFINVMPADGGSAPAGGEITNGSYSVKEIPPGKKIIEIIGVKKVTFASSTDEMRLAAEEAKKKGDDSGLVEPADIIPRNAEGNLQEIELVAGSQSKDFALKTPANKPQ
jgi:hypothetical protein